MRLYVQETQRWVVERAKGTAALSVAELAQVLEVLPNGYRLAGLTNRDDGATVLILEASERKEVKL